ncbi:MAG TPA: nucleoside 2-deoxyribosyltransferase [Reyranella sp.]|nr:nucleoside 2-deoxyribosyltransferase [Reyranella sp.]
MKKVYLAGPITGLDYKGATDWRDEAITKLQPIAGMSPMRGKDYLRNLASMPHKSDELAAIGHVLSSSRGIMTRDRYDCTTCDVLLVNFLGAQRVSIGTVMEVAWADANRIPIVCAMEKGNVHEHGMVDEAIGFRVDTLDEAIRICRIILLGADA